MTNMTLNLGRRLNLASDKSCFRSRRSTLNISNMSITATRAPGKVLPPTAQRISILDQRKTALHSHNKRLAFYAISEPSSEEEAEEQVTQEELDVPHQPQTFMQHLDAFHRFTRPHTIIGTALSVVSVSLLAVRTTADLNLIMLGGLMQALIPALLMNVSIVGLNQLYDIEIDKINKPYLPLAAGDMTVKTAKWLVGGTGAVALALGVLSASPALFATLAISLALGVVYSTELPMLRWKKYPVLAAACIFIVRAVLVQLGFFFHMRCHVLGGTAVATPPLLFATSFMCLCSVVIALFKDIPDVKGDKIAEVKTLSVRLGVNKVFNICKSLLFVAYGGAMVAGYLSSNNFSAVFTIVSHAVLAAIMWSCSLEVDLESSKSLYKFYMVIWKLFYAEYLLIPFLR